MKNAFRTTRLGLTLLIMCLCTFLPLKASAEEQKMTVGPGEIYAELQRINLRLDALRVFMGKVESEIAMLDVEGAVPREVYFQAVNLYQKSDRLALETTRTTKAIQPVSEFDKITGSEVFQIINLAKKRIDLVISKLGVQFEEPPVSPPEDISLSDVYENILDTNQKINNLLDLKYSPGDVFQQVTTALHLTFTLYERFPGERRIEQEPKLIPGKQPSDVYKLLLQCFDIIRQIATDSGVEILELNAIPKSTPYVPSEVYDIATLLTSELSYIHATVPGLSKPAMSHFPGKKFPFHVFQRAQMLRQTLSRLHYLIMQNPNWRD